MAKDTTVKETGTGGSDIDTLTGLIADILQDQLATFQKSLHSYVENLVKDQAGLQKRPAQEDLNKSPAPTRKCIGANFREPGIRVTLVPTVSYRLKGTGAPCYWSWSWARPETAPGVWV